MNLEMTSDDLHLFNEGRHFRLYEKMGASCIEDGVRFAVWAPNARKVSVIGDFNSWTKERHPLEQMGSSGVWTGFFRGIRKGDRYKYHILSEHRCYEVEKADPFADYAEIPPHTASVVHEDNYKWGDSDWIKHRLKNQSTQKAMSIYELHLGSWARKLEEDNRPLSYIELAEKLPSYVKKMGFTHIELLPITEHPFYGSWGYQCTGYFAPTSRYGKPEDFKYLVDAFHQEGIGVLLDWVPSHFPSDTHGLSYFDGTHLYEHEDPRQGYHPDWNSFIFNYSRNEVRSFLISSAISWLDRYHIDGIRVDAVASMLYLDYSRKNGEWVPNQFGGRENIAAIDFLRQLNESIYQFYPDTHSIAEESTAWPMVSRPTYVGGLGFGMKWDMGWMHDTLEYFREDPVFRKYHQDRLSFRMMYAFHENFVLSLSHDEVVHGKGSLLGKMPGDDWQKFANLRVLYSYMFAQPGKKLLFMGSEFGQWNEWNHESSLDWHLLTQAEHQGLAQCLSDLNRLYREEESLHQLDFSPEGFEWADASDSAQSVMSFYRKNNSSSEICLAVFNLTPVPRTGYRLGVPQSGLWEEIFNSDAKEYGGSGYGNQGGLSSTRTPSHGKSFSVDLTLPPLAGIYLRWKSE